MEDDLKYFMSYESIFRIKKKFYRQLQDCRCWTEQNVELSVTNLIILYLIYNMTSQYKIKNNNIKIIIKISSSYSRKVDRK